MSAVLDVERTSAVDHLERRVPSIAHTLDTDPAVLRHDAKCTLDRMNACIVSGDVAAAEDEAVRHEAIVWLLNGRTWLGTHAHDRSAGNVLAEYCRVPDGAPAQWGRRSTFAVTVDGMRAVVHHDMLGSVLHAHLSFYAVEADRPFLSPTGYQSVFVQAVAETTLEDMATQMMRELVAASRVPIDPAYRRQVQCYADRWPVLAQSDALTPDDRTYAEANGQVAFGF